MTTHSQDEIDAQAEKKVPITKPATALKFSDIEAPPPPAPAPVPAPPPGIQIGEMLVWKGWWWTLTEIGEGGKILFILKGPTVNHALKAKLSGERSARQAKKARKRLTMKSKLRVTALPGRGAR